jgi:hypothetical protein
MYVPVSIELKINIDKGMLMYFYRLQTTDFDYPMNRRY